MNDTIIIVGLGGIGSWLVEPLMRYCIHETRRQYSYIFIDGDHYSNSNQSRQCVHPKLTGMNKASAAALKMRQYFPNADIKEIPEFINEDNVTEILNTRSNLWIFNCCDNNYCRKILAEAIVKVDRPSAFLFTGGNELTDGNSHVQSIPYGRSSNKSVIESHPEIAEAQKTEDRGVMSCQQLINMPASNQIVVTNFWCAAIMLQQFYLCMKSKPIQETFFDINTSAINAIK